jgi:hypothetical protein
MTPIEVPRGRPLGKDSASTDHTRESVTQTADAATAWRRNAYAVLEILAGTGIRFSADDVLMLARAPVRGRQLGAVFGVAVRRKIITPAGAIVGDGARLLRIWRGAR